MLPFPPLTNNNNIAESELSSRCINAPIRKLINNRTFLKRAAMHTLFTRGLRGERQKETEIGLMPEGWGW